MEPKEVIRYLTSQIETRKEILKIAYGSEEAKRKKIESWIDTEMLAKLLELKEKNKVERAEGEHNYDVLKIGPKGKKTYPRCDLWWEKNGHRYFLEIKTFRFHRNTGLKSYKDRIIEDLDKEQYLKSPYHFHHLLIVFDDNHYDNGNWKEDLYKFYNSSDFKIEDEWNINLDERRTAHIFLHYKSEDNQ